MMEPGVSIVICCYNSQDRLPKTLQHVGAQLPLVGGRIELVVVDNCCTDETVLVVQRWHQRQGRAVTLKVVREEQLGLTWARIRGIRSATFETVIFCDDDNWLATDYCQHAYEILTSHPEVGLAGGCSSAVTEVEPPSWFWAISGAWAVGESDYVGYLEGPDAFLRGAGLVVRRSLFLALLESGFRFLASGRCGTNLNSGEDAEISTEFRRMGSKLYFDARLHLQHWIPKTRLTRAYALRLWQGFGASTLITDADRVFQNPSQTLRNKVRCSWIYQLLRGLLNLVLRLHEHPMFHPSDPRPSLRFCSLLGRLKAIFILGSEYTRTIKTKIDWIEKHSCMSKEISNEVVTNRESQI